jgi:hypothetical protein
MQNVHNKKPIAKIWDAEMQNLQLEVRDRMDIAEIGLLGCKLCTLFARIEEICDFKCRFYILQQLAIVLRG